MLELAKAIKQIFLNEFFRYSFYLSFGIFLSEFAHIYVYQRNGGNELATWFSQFNLTKPLPAMLAIQSVPSANLRDLVFLE